MDAAPKADFFTLLLEDKMKQAIQSSIRYCLKVFTNRSDSLVSLRYFEDELCITIELFVQAYFNSKFSAFSSEYFYGLFFYQHPDHPRQQSTDPSSKAQVAHGLLYLELPHSQAQACGGQSIAWSPQGPLSSHGSPQLRIEIPVF
jgi:hypothetical protein